MLNVIKFGELRYIKIKKNSNKKFDELYIFYFKLLFLSLFRQTLFFYLLYSAYKPTYYLS